MIITIDGPAGSGKSTIAKEVAKKLKFIHLNSGLLYRAVAKASYDLSISHENEARLGDLARSLKFDFELNLLDFTTNTKIIYLNDNLVLEPELLLSEKWSQAASKISVYSSVRNILTAVQRECGVKNSLVLEGRDSGSVVFPEADYKFYLKAPLMERVKRRVAQEMSGKNISLDFYAEIESKILEDIKSRDFRDSSREVSPHIVPFDARVIDTENLTVYQVVEAINNEIASK
jgi:cytidylate kinase